AADTTPATAVDRINAVEDGDPPIPPFEKGGLGGICPTVLSSQPFDAHIFATGSTLLTTDPHAAVPDACKSPLAPLFQRGGSEVEGEEATADGRADKAAPLGRVTYASVWDGISVTYDAPGSGIARSTWTLAPGADPAAIHLRYNRVVTLTDAG